MDPQLLLFMLLPLTVGCVVGYRTDGSPHDRMQTGAMYGILMTVVSVLLFGSYVLYGIQVTAQKPYWPNLLVVISGIAGIWTLAIGLYATGTAAVGAIIGGYIAGEGV